VRYVLLLLLVLVFPAPTFAQGEPALPFHYLALGNSLAVGAEAAANYDGQPGYPALLFEKIQDLYPDATMQNLAVVGETSSSFLAGQMAAAESAMAVQCPDLVTVDVGGNDVGNLLTNQQNADQVFATFESNFSQILDRLRSACPTKIVAMNYYNPYPGLGIPMSNQPLADIWVPRLNQIISSVAASRGVAVAPVYEAFAPYDVGELTYVNPAIYSNPLLKVPWLPGFEANVDFHPRPAGHAIIADLMYQAAGLLPPVPTLAELPDLMPASISYTLPWTCSETSCTDPAQTTVMQSLATPQTQQAWLAGQFHERIARPIVCWSLTVSQETMNAYASWLNTTLIPGLNSLYKLLYLMLIWLTVAFHGLVYILESIREIVWRSYGVLLQIEQNTRLAALDAAALADSWMGAAKALAYMVGLYMNTVPGLFTVLLDLENNKPPQLQEIEHFWGLEALRGIYVGINTSVMGWWLMAQYGLACLGLALDVGDELKEL
jgi:lysophospholipase L1-like esterase